MEIGRHRIGLRAEPAAAGDALRAALEGYVVADEAVAPNFSLRIALDERELHLLYRGSCIEARSSDPARVITALMSQLDVYAGPPTGSVQVHGAAVVRDGAAMIIPPTLRQHLPDLGRRLVSAGVLVHDVQIVSIDLGAAELVVERQLDIESAPLASLAALVPSRRPEPSVTRGRYPIVRWMFTDHWRDGVVGPRRLSRATAVRRVTLVPDAARRQPPLAQLGELFAAVEAVGVEPSSRDEVVDLLTRFPG